MIEPVDVQQIATAAILSGAIIFFGAAYAVFFALSQLRDQSGFSGYAYAFYGGLVVCTVGLAGVLHLTGWWLTLVVTLLVGYLLAPRFIWRVSVDVHALEDPDDREADPAPHPADPEHTARNLEKGL